MKIIVVEGLDKSGKHTATTELIHRMDALGIRVAHSEFHRYDTPTGKLIMKWLKNEWPVSQETIELIMAADKQAQQDWFDRLEQDGVDFLILDRYTMSQRVYAKANGMPADWIASLQRFMKEPDYQMLIDITPDASMARKGKHNDGNNDRYEADLELLTRVRDAYLDEDCDYVLNGMQSLNQVIDEVYDTIYTHFELNNWE